MLRTLYRAAWAVAAPLAPLAARKDTKLGRTIRGRLAAAAVLERWAATARDTSRPLVWFHAASVGEGRQAAAVIGELRRMRPHWQVAYTFASASAEQFAAELPADVVAYLPPDTVRATRAALAALRPSAVVFSATDVWPELTRQAAQLGVPVGLVSANLGAASSRRGFLARTLLGPAYATLDLVGAVGDEDARGLAALGVPPARIRVTGDSRHDAAHERASRADEARRGWLALLHRHAEPVLVAGSTWPADERVLLPAVARVRARRPLRLVVAPHEPLPAVLGRLERQLADALPGAVVRRLAALEALGGGAATGDPWDVCVVDRVGVLFDLYAGATVAYIGGAFHRAGLHSVIEPAAFGVPVFFGPRWRTSRDAGLLLDAGGAVSAEDVPTLAAALTRLLDDTTARAAAGAAARAVVKQGVGAAARSAALVIELAERRGRND